MKNCYDQLELHRSCQSVRVTKWSHCLFFLAVVFLGTFCVNKWEPLIIQRNCLRVLHFRGQQWAKTILCISNALLDIVQIMIRWWLCFTFVWHKKLIICKLTHLESSTIIHKILSNKLTNFSLLWWLWFNFKFWKFKLLYTKHIKMRLMNSSWAMCAWTAGVYKS